MTIMVIIGWGLSRRQLLRQPDHYWRLCVMGSLHVSASISFMVWSGHHAMRYQARTSWRQIMPVLNTASQASPWPFYALRFAATTLLELMVSKKHADEVCTAQSHFCVPNDTTEKVLNGMCVKLLSWPLNRCLPLRTKSCSSFESGWCVCFSAGFCSSQSLILPVFLLVSLGRMR